jgi:hypothetical protein
LVNPPEGSTSPTTIAFDETGIAWPSDKKRLAPTSMQLNQIVPPPNWQKRFGAEYTAEKQFNPAEDEHFQVWMRTSWYPTFRKLYSAYRTGEISPGTYTVDVVLSK